MKTDNALLSFYCPHCKNRIETSVEEVNAQDTFTCPTCNREITEDIRALAEDLERS